MNVIFPYIGSSQLTFIFFGSTTNQGIKVCVRFIKWSVSHRGYPWSLGAINVTYHLIPSPTNVASTPTSTPAWTLWWVFSLRTRAERPPQSDWSRSNWSQQSDSSNKYPAWYTYTHSYWTWQFTVDFPIKTGWIFHSYVNSPEGRLHLHFAYQVSNNLKKNNPSVFQRTRTQVFIIAPSHNQLVVIIVINLHATTIKIHQSVTRYY
jgi:hypothetical protein